MKPCAHSTVRRGRPRVSMLLTTFFPNNLFRLSFWKVAAEEINYRRFFCVNGLISLRVEDEHVLNHTHGLIFDLIGRRSVTGLRIDHVDGLYDPTSYLQKVTRKSTRHLYHRRKNTRPRRRPPPILAAAGHDGL